METQNIIVALIIGLLVLFVITAIFIPRLIAVDKNSTAELNATIDRVLNTAAPKSSSASIVSKSVGAARYGAIIVEQNVLF